MNISGWVFFAKLLHRARVAVPGVAWKNSGVVRVSTIIRTTYGPIIHEDMNIYEPNNH